ncbi:hypothetical protein PIB30_023733 [Stylosanthes scabra]|uniref:Uncharacterized protein n=1 Tax=Stylosanthes scabra TaxID=79078 RepID=A0ABU6V9G2_9FABA|nr:hypothetical protein [Stylosanthes scabra]
MGSKSRRSAKSHAIFDLERQMWRDTRILENAKTTYHSLTEFNHGVGLNIWFIDDFYNYVQIRITREGNTITMSGEHIVITQGFSVLPSHPEFSLYAGRILPTTIKHELHLTHGVLFDIHREMLWEGENMGEVIYQTTKPKVPTQNSRIGTTVEHEASTMPRWDPWNAATGANY